MLFYLVATCFFIKEIIKKEYLNEKKKKVFDIWCIVK